MSIIRYGAPLEILVVTKGHPFERDSFFGLFEGHADGRGGVGRDHHLPGLAARLCRGLAGVSPAGSSAGAADFNRASRSRPC